MLIRIVVRHQIKACGGEKGVVVVRCKIVDLNLGSLDYLYVQSFTLVLVVLYM